MSLADLHVIKLYHIIELLTYNILQMKSQFPNRILPLLALEARINPFVDVLLESNPVMSLLNLRHNLVYASMRVLVVSPV